MPLEVKQAVRQFRFNSQLLNDPNPAMSAEEVLDFYSLTYPDMASAQLKEPDMNATDGTIVYEIETKLGTKG